jgi:hypothetical protein
MISAAELKHISTDVCVSFMKQAELTMLQQSSKA